MARRNQGLLSSVVKTAHKALGTAQHAASSVSRGIRTVRQGFKALGTTKTTFHAQTGKETKRTYLPGTYQQRKQPRRLDY